LGGENNYYVYGNYNPINYIDPLGLWSLALFGLSLGAGALYIGGAINNSQNSQAPIFSTSPPTPQPTSKSLSDAHQAAAGNRSAAGYGGNCTPDEHDELKDKQDAACNKAKGLSCIKPIIDYRAADEIEKCINARIDIARKCFMGGDKGHNDQINDLRRAVGKCMGHQW
jgi:Novel toxin 16